jgi:MurNAc alpha-1-phosphate uridylyltransferase
MQTVILAGGLATRLRPHSENVPKSMIMVGNKPFLEHQLDLLRRNGISDIVLCVGHLSRMIKDHFGDGSKFGVRIRYSDEGENLLGTGGALKKAEPLLEDRFFVLYGDSYLMYDYQAISSYSRKFPGFCVMVIYRNHNFYDNSNLEIQDGLVNAYDKANPDGKLVYIDAGLSILKKKYLTQVPPQRPSSLEELYCKIVDTQRMLAYQVYRRFYEIGSPRGLAELQELMKHELALSC